jgi:predicted RNA-binding protein with PUA-like domain
MKSEPSEYSIDDLQKDKTEHWDGVRNYQARNFMKAMKKGDKILFYHSKAKEIGISGIAKVSKEAYPDFTAWDKNDPHFDPKTDKEQPTWFMVDVQFVKKCKNIITLSTLRSYKTLQDMLILRKGNRLSVTPVTKKEFDFIVGLNKK